MSDKLQYLIGTGKRNPFFSVCRDENKPGYLYVYFGATLLEVVPDDRSNFEFKLLIARLYNAKVKIESIRKAFGVARTTMKRWGDAIKSGDPERLIEALSGQGAPRKLTSEVKAFVRVRFLSIYKENHYNYSAIIRNEIKEIFKKDISAESLRPIFNDLKDHVEEVRLNSLQSNQKENNHNEIEGEVTIDYSPEDIKCENVEMEMEESNDNKKLPIEIEEKGIVNRRFIRKNGGCVTVDAKPYEETIERANICDLINSNMKIDSSVDTPYNELIPVSESRHESHFPLKSNRNISLKQAFPNKRFCHHVGAMIFSFELSEFYEFIRDDMAKQLLLTVLLGSKNIEQTKLLDFNAIKVMLGFATPNLHVQRKSLSELATEDNIKGLLRYNAKLINADQYNDFFFDPHTKHYTGVEIILKGWCAGTRSANKIINMDFIHTAPDGYPVYVEECDNFYDLRERFLKEIEDFREVLGCDDSIMTFIVDRGIYSNDIFETIADHDKLHIITWEKGYKKGNWDEYKINGKFSIFKCRNNSRDLVKYYFEYIGRIWEKNLNIRQIIVKATNPKGRIIEVSILTDDPDRNAEEIINLIFSRWVQENDFKYEIEHFGINEITTYSKVSYSKIRDLVNDKKTKRGEYKARERETETIRRKLKSALYKEQTIKSEKRKKELGIKIEKLMKGLEEAIKRRAETQKKGSKLEELISNNYKRLNTSNKKYMDCIKIIARNIFYKAIARFKKKYDNFRDDHVLFRNVTQGHGVIKLNKDDVHVTIFPTAHLQPKIRGIIDEVFDELNKRKPKFPDGSERIVKLKIGNKHNDLLFAVQQEFRLGN